MKQIQHRSRCCKGFTLIEMLIVVAIIAVLVLVSVPMVSTSLEKAREATDDANERAAKAAAVISYLMAGETGSETYFYNANGTVMKEVEYGGTGSGITPDMPGYDYGQSEGNKDKYVVVMITNNNGDMEVTTDWHIVK